jgi:hypothetical protein
LDSRRLILVTLLGTLAFVSTGFLPSPFDKIFIVFQALTFALGSLLLARGGATYVSLINGILLTILRIEYFPFSFLFSLMYGFMVDSAFYIFKVRANNDVSGTRLIMALMIVTAITGLTSMYITTLIGLMPINSVLYLAILAVGVLSGAIAGYLTLIIWKRVLIQLKSETGKPAII